MKEVQLYGDFRRQGESQKQGKMDSIGKTGEVLQTERKKLGDGKMIRNEKKMQWETVWSNIRDLMQILLIQFRPVFYWIIILAILVPLWNLFQTYIEMTSDPTPWYLQICGGGYLELMIMVGALLGSSYNILSRNEISMYPGTIISRYAATVLVFHAMILWFVLASVISYLLQGFLLWVASRLWENCLPGNFFSLSYLWHGSVRYLALLLAVSAIGTFYSVLLERFRVIRVYLCTFVLFAICVVLAKWGYLDGIMQCVKNLFLGKGYSYASLIAVLLVIWGILMLLSGCLAGTVKVWREADKRRFTIVVVILYLAGISSAFLVLTRGGYSYEMDPVIFQQESNHQAEVVVDISDWDEKDKTLLSTYEMWIKYQNPSKENCVYQSDPFASVSCSASEAKRYGLSFDESKLDEDHIILLLGARNLTFAGKDLGKEALQAYQQSTKLVKDPVDEEYQEENPEEEFSPDYYYQTEITKDPVIAINCLYGNLGMFMDDTTLNSEGNIWNSTNVTESLLRIVIYPD